MSVRGLINRSTPAGHLPSKVLEQVIEMRASDQDRLSASQVSRHWRDVIIFSPRLWTEFRCGSVATTQQCLMRSEPLPISVIADSDSNFEAVTALKFATDRLKSLTLRLSPPSFWGGVRALAYQSHSLENLKLYPPSEGPYVPEKFLDSSAATLKSLLKSQYLNNINVQLKLFEFPVLTHLTFTTNGTWRFDMSQLFHVFTSARLLQEVCVTFFGPTTPIPAGHEVVRLPRMKKLNFSNKSGKFPKRLLSSLHVPSVEKIELDIYLPRKDRRTVPDFLPPKLRDLPHFSKLDSLELGVSQAHCDIRYSGPNGMMSIRSSHHNAHSDWFGSPIADVKDLTLLCCYGRLDFLKFLGTMDRVESLAIKQHETTCSVIQELGSMSIAGSFLFPRLESLTFLPSELMRKHQHLTDVAPSSIFPGLTAMARARDKAGFRISKVSSECSTTFSRSDVESLKPYVTCVQLKTADLEQSHSSDPLGNPPPLNHPLSQPPLIIADPRDHV